MPTNRKPDKTLLISGIPPDLHKAVKIYAISRGMSMSGLTRAMWEALLKRQKGGSGSSAKGKDS